MGIQTSKLSRHYWYRKVYNLGERMSCASQLQQQNLRVLREVKDLPPSPNCAPPSPNCGPRPLPLRFRSNLRLLLFLHEQK